MNEPTRAKLRNRARILHWMTQLFLVCALVITVVSGVFLSLAGQKYGLLTLFRSEDVVMDGFFKYQEDRLRDLANYSPPSGEDERREWVEQIKSFMDQPAAVFIKDDDAIHWLSVPEKFFPVIGDMPRLFDPDVKGNERWRLDTVGTVFYRGAFLGGDSLGASVRIYGLSNSNERWGILYKWEDVWRPFCASLDRAKHGTELEPAGRLVKSAVQLQGSDDHPANEKTGMRAVLDGDVLFQSPGLDTTAQSFFSGIKKPQLEFYLSLKDSRWAKLISRQVNVWSTALIIILLMVAFNRLYTWFKQFSADA